MFRDALGARGVVEPTGSVVELLSGNREFAGRGYVDQDHAIAIRVLARDPATDVAPGTGTIAARFEGGITKEEIGPALEKLIAGQAVVVGS